jgi:hypothetical protein
VSAAPDSPWMRRIRPVTEKKARLSVDSWGSTDDAIAEVMKPVLDVFEREYPDFNPFPFGKLGWVQTIVRSILLAEPMVKDFQKCFEGITDDATVIALADSFAFRNCVKREPLAELIASRSDAAGSNTR